LWAIRSLQAAIVAYRAGTDPTSLADAVGATPWPTDLVVVDRGELERLRAMERPEQERQRDAKTLAAAAPHPTSAPVMGRPGVPGGWRSVEDAAELPPWTPAAARADQVEDLDDDEDDDDEASVLDGRIVDVFEPP
jgi:hypothetical protein